jgi:hypothetical protein
MPDLVSPADNYGLPQRRSESSMPKTDPETLNRIVRLLDEALALLDEQGLDRAAAHLDLCRHEVQRTLGLLRNGSS